MVLRNASTNPGSMVSPPANSSAVSSQSTLPSFRAMKPSRLAAMWIVTRESVVALEDMQPLVSGKAFLLQELFQSQIHFGPNISRVHPPIRSQLLCVRQIGSGLCRLTNDLIEMS